MNDIIQFAGYGTRSLPTTLGENKNRRDAPMNGRTAAWEGTGATQLRALKGLLGGLIAIGGSERRVARILRILERELQQQIMPDGGHRSRSPSVQLEVLRDLIDIRAALRAARAARSFLNRRSAQPLPPVLADTRARPCSRSACCTDCSVLPT